MLIVARRIKSHPSATPEIGVIRVGNELRLRIITVAEGAQLEGEGRIGEHPTITATIAVTRGIAPVDLLGKTLVRQNEKGESHPCEEAYFGRALSGHFSLTNFVPNLETILDDFGGI